MKRVLLLASTTSYRLDDFAAAARRLGVEAVIGIDRCHQLAEIWDREKFGGSLPVELRESARAAQQIVAEARVHPFDALIATDDPTAEIAALAARELGLPGNAPEAARTARNKRLMRDALFAARVPSPRHQVFPLDAPPDAPRFPCVLKPLLCSASRGVMRADDPAGFRAAWQRLVALLETPALRAVEDPDGHQILVEDFVPGAEVAVEGVLTSGRLRVLAIFDKPDPLDGPFFEETLYITPSRHSETEQARIAEVTAAAARAIGLVEGPIHAELRLSPSGLDIGEASGASRGASEEAVPTRMPVLIEIAARSIGGLCARTLRFGLGEASLEEIVLRHALGDELGAADVLARSGAAGVMMIPIPKGGVFHQALGVEAAREVPLIEDVVISAQAGQVLVPLPEGHAYLGFLFARGEAPEAVEAALREAHRRLAFRIAPTLT
ncbi:MAG TPA: ATP-grasp domain-containing protein [Polyangia bacterium]